MASTSKGFQEEQEVEPSTAFEEREHALETPKPKVIDLFDLYHKLLIFWLLSLQRNQPKVKGSSKMRTKGSKVNIENTEEYLELNKQLKEMIGYSEQYDSEKINELSREHCNDDQGQLDNLFNDLWKNLVDDDPMRGGGSGQPSSADVLPIPNVEEIWNEDSPRKSNVDSSYPFEEKDGYRIHLRAPSRYYDPDDPVGDHIRTAEGVFLRMFQGLENLYSIVGRTDNLGR